MVAITGASELFIAVNALIAPVPVAGSPILLLSFVQLQVVVPGVLLVEKSMELVAVPLQTS